MQRYEDKHFTKTLTVELTANQVLMNQAAVLDKDADFFWTGIDVSYTGYPFGVRFTDSTGYQLSDGYMGSFAFASNVGIGIPYELMPSIWFPAGSAIVLDLQEQSNNPQTIQFMFHGIKRFYYEDNAA